MSIARKIAGYVSIVLVTIIFFDLVAYFFAPKSLTQHFVHYKCNDCVKISGIKGNGRYPFQYFESHPERGMDIAKGVRNRLHIVEGRAYQVWSNELGCFDKEQNPKKPYIYLAGDSFTWGFSSYRLKFGTLLEEKLNTGVLKCGVSHTGQAHQFSKMKEIVGSLSEKPGLIVTVFSINDIQNDLAHPHSTVVEGWQLDYVRLSLQDDQVFHRKAEDLKAFKDQSEKRLKAGKNPLQALDYVNNVKPVGWHYRHMLSYNLFKALKRKLKSKPSKPNLENIQIYHAPVLEKNNKLFYKDNPNAKKNKDAILSFKEYASSLGSDFVLALMPPKAHWGNQQYFDELKEFLTEQKIQFIDLSEVFFQQTEYEKYDIYWVGDGHIREQGNAIVADTLEKWVLKNRPDLMN